MSGTGAEPGGRLTDSARPRIVVGRLAAPEVPGAGSRSGNHRAPGTVPERSKRSDRDPHPSHGGRQHRAARRPPRPARAPTVRIRAARALLHLREGPDRRDPRRPRTHHPWTRRPPDRLHRARRVGRTVRRNRRSPPTWRTSCAPPIRSALDTPHPRCSSGTLSVARPYSPLPPGSRRPGPWPRSAPPSHPTTSPICSTPHVTRPSPPATPR